MSDKNTKETSLVVGKEVGLISKIAGRYNVDPKKLLKTLKDTAFKQRNGVSASDEQMMALLVVADQYKLNPFTQEIYAYPDSKNGIVPVVGINGWSHIINSHKSFDGMEFVYSENNVSDLAGQLRPCPEWCECVVYRKDRAHPVTVREYLDEVYRPPFKQGLKSPWQTHTRRMLRHKTIIQAARIAFAFVGIFDEDEAQRINEAQVAEAEVVTNDVTEKGVSGMKEKLMKSKPVTEEIDPETGEIIGVEKVLEPIEGVE
jgi:phage recombination protein Bet